MSRVPFGVFVYLHQSVVLLVPIILLFCLPSSMWYFLALKVLIGVWLAGALVVLFVLSTENDVWMGGAYRQNRRSFVYIMVSTTLILWRPNSVLFWIGLVGLLFFSIGYMATMQKIYREKKAGHDPTSVAEAWGHRWRKISREDDGPS